MDRSLYRPKPHSDLTPPLAESLLALDFPESDAARIGELNIKANEANLTVEEESELAAYINVNDLLAYCQSKARQSLQRRGSDLATSK